MTSPPKRPNAIHLLRHGETAWSGDRRHTGRTDLPLTDDGRRQARALRSILAELEPTLVLSSPLARATETAALAGFGDRLHLDDRLVEWDYGTAEGRTTADIRRSVPGWTVWTHPIEGGEQLDDVAGRADAVVADLRCSEGEVLVFGHAHLLRILAARWCGLPPAAGANLTLDPAGMSTLAWERETPCLLRWNVVPEPVGLA